MSKGEGGGGGGRGGYSDMWSYSDSLCFKS